MGSTDNQSSVDALTLYNLPCSATEDYVQSLFPSAQQVNLIRGSNDPTNSQNMCILKFNSPYECQKAYVECGNGKEVAGRMLRAELGDGCNYGNSQRTSQGGGSYRNNEYDSQADRRSSGRQDQRYSSDYQGSGDHKNGQSGCNLTLSNLPYSASESDVWNEFPEALKVVLNFDERGRSRGVAQLSFSTKEQCSAAYQSCNYKMMNGRPIRGRMTRDDENGQSRQDAPRDFGNRGGRYNDGQRDFGGGRPNRYGDDQRNYGGGGGRQGRYGDEQRDFGGRQGSQGNYNRDRENRYGNHGNRGGYGGGGNRGGQGYGGGRGRGGGPNRFGNRDDRGDSFGGRRDRSPGRDEPIRGYGNNKGPRITSAVINRPGGISPQSSSSSSDED